MPFGEVIAVLGQRLGEAKGLAWSSPLSGLVLTPGESTYSRHGQLPHTGSGWLVTCLSFLAVVALGAGVTYVVRRFMPTRSTPELQVLLNQSAAFYARWPEPELTYAPKNEMMAEAIRCQRIIDLLRRRAQVNNGESKYLMGPIGGVQSWLTLLHQEMNLAARA
jgi:hypothetical protein